MRVNTIIEISDLWQVNIGRQGLSVSFSCDSDSVIAIHRSLVNFYDMSLAKSNDVVSLDDTDLLEVAQIQRCDDRTGIVQPFLGSVLSTTVGQQGEYYLISIQGVERTMRFSCRRPAYVSLVRDLGRALAQLRGNSGGTHLEIL